MEFGDDDHAEKVFLRFWDLFIRYRFRINARQTRGDGYDLPTRDNISVVLGHTNILAEDSPDVTDIVDVINGLRHGPEYLFQIEYLSAGDIIEYEIWLPVGDGLFYVIDNRDQLVRLRRSQISNYIKRRMTLTASSDLSLTADRRHSYSIESIDDFFTNDLDAHSDDDF